MRLPRQAGAVFTCLVALQAMAGARSDLDILTYPVGVVAAALETVRDGVSRQCIA